MSTTIEWTQRPGTKGETWNPTTGCNKVSQGCKNCYAEVMHKRLRGMHQPKYRQHFSAGVVTHADTLTIPLEWKKPRTVFVNSMSDLFHADVPFKFIDQVFAVMALTPQHTYQILTKRPERMAEYFTSGKRTFIPGNPRSNGDGGYVAARILNEEGSIRDRVIEAACRIADVKFAGDLPETYWPLPNVWLGTSVEDQKAADERIPHLLRCPAAVRFLSCEPLLGAVSINGSVQCTNCMHVDHKMETAYCTNCKQRRYDPGDFKYVIYPGIHWVIAGGESGHGARPMHPDWARSLRDQCQEAGVPFFFKQWGEWAHDGSTCHSLYEEQEQGQLIPCKDLNGGVIVRNSAHHEATHYIVPTSKHTATMIRRVGKHASGNVLDGRTHLEYPKVG